MRIKELIKEKGLSVSELAQIMGIKQESLSRTINGNPTLETLEKIAAALKVNVYDLFEKPSNTDIIGVIKANNHSYEINSISDIEKLLEEIKAGQV